MLTNSLPVETVHRTRTISRDGIVQFTTPGDMDLNERQAKANEWLRTKQKGGMFPWDCTDMFERLVASMRLAGGVGLSANQIGFPARAFVIETPKRQMRVYDPVILEVSDVECSMNEGCLSVSDLDEMKTDATKKFVSRGRYIDRPTAIVVEYHNGAERVREGLVGFESRVFQHEYDHLNGFIFTDHVVIGRNIRKKMLLTAGDFEPTFIKYESLVGRMVSKNFFELGQGTNDLDEDGEYVYIDPCSDMLRTTPGNFRQRLIRLIDDDLVKSIEAW